MPEQQPLSMSHELRHISQLSDNYVGHPAELFDENDEVTARVFRPLGCKIKKTCAGNQASHRDLSDEKTSGLILVT